jgi:DNA-binding SARP family transcriptional activator/pimeloyl-ACP methyl ester carboxylesterase
MEFRVLGPFEVVAGEDRVALGGTKQRALLARLLLDAGRTVAADRLVEDLWGEAPPETAKKMIQVYVSRLRKLLPQGTLQTRAPGYQFAPPAGSLDLERFERFRAEGRAALEQGRHDDARRALCDALALWRGPPLAEFAHEPFAAPEAARLAELRTAALEERIEADLELGRSSDVVAELEALVAEHPMRERLRGHLMVSLYRSGRQAEALNVFHDARRVLSDELGLEPSDELRDLELRILRHDPSLATRQAARRLPVRRPVVRYARSGDLNIAYQVTGDGPIDVVLVSGFVSHLEKDWEDPRHAHYLERLGSMGRLIRFDKRGTGLSDRPPGLPDLEARMDDVRAVMDAAGSRRAVLFGYSEGAPMAILFAASYPERTRALILYGAYAKRLDPDEDYPWAPTREARAADTDRLEHDWGLEANMKVMCPSADAALERWWGERCRAAASPGAIRALMEMNSLIDVRALLPAIRVPTLVVHRGTDYDVRVEEGRYIAERVPGARFVELSGADHFVGVDPDQILDVVEPFLVASADVQLPTEERVLVTLLAVEVGGSGAMDDVLRTELGRYRGREIERTGDRILAGFDGPARAVRCAIALASAARARGVALRAGIHTGEVEITGGRTRGIAVELAARVAAEAAPGEVLVTRTVTDLVAGSGLEFADRASPTVTGGERDLLAARVPDLIVGRADELERLERALRRAASGTGSTVLVAGEAGIGKTRMASELAMRARAAGFEVLVGHCLDLVGTELPYQPFAEALRPLAARRGRELPFVDAGSQLRLFEDTLALIDAADAPVLLVLEDLHWADTSTIDLLAYLAHNLDDRRVVLLATFRADERASTERVRRLAHGVRRSRWALLLELGPLAPDALAALLAARAGAAPPPALAEAIVARSEGNPFFAEELLAATDDESRELPRGLRDLLLQRVARLDATTTSVLRLASAAGRDVGYPLLRAASALPEHDVHESLRQAVEHGVFVADRERFRFRHALLAEAIYTTLLPGEREKVHARLAEALARGEPPAAAAELAPHWAAAHRVPEALVACVEAAREAEAVFGLAEALTHLERALQLWAQVPDAAERVGLDLADLASWAAECALLIGAAPRAVELGERAIDVVGEGDPARAGLLHARLGRYLLLGARRDAALAAFERAVELVPPQPPSAERAEVLAALGNAQMLTLRHHESRASCEQALAIAGAVSARRAEFRALFVLGVDLAYLGHGQEGLAALWRALRLAEEDDEPEDQFRAYTCLTDALTMLGRPRESARLAAEAVDVIRRYGIEHGVLVANWVEALVAAGEWEEADRVSAAALGANTANWPHNPLVSRAELEAGRGDFDAARTHLEAALASVREDERGLRTYEPVAAELALWERRWADADAAVRDALPRTRARDVALYRVRLCAQGLRAQAELGDLDRARELVADARQAAAEAAQVTPNAAGWLALAEAEYERARGTARPHTWAEAAATWDRLERPPLAAYCRWRQAEGLVAAGADATVPLEGARDAAARMGARPMLRELELLTSRLDEPERSG